VTVAFVDDDVAQQAPWGTAVVRDALRAWEALPLRLRFNIVQDTTTADVVVRWIPRFDPVEKRAGQTEIEFDQDGNIRHAAIRLAITGSDGRRLDRAAAMMVAMHEMGHTLGLPHPADSRGVIYATPPHPTVGLRPSDFAILAARTSVTASIAIAPPAAERRCRRPGRRLP